MNSVQEIFEALRQRLRERAVVLSSVVVCEHDPSKSVFEVWDAAKAHGERYDFKLDGTPRIKSTPKGLARSVKNAVEELTK